jgi:transposase
MNSIKNLLNIQDRHIKMIKSYEAPVKGQIVKIVEATLNNRPSRCPKCQAKIKLHKHGTKVAHILLSEVSGFKTYLYLAKQTYFCPSCRQYSSAFTDIHEPNCFISKALNLAIAQDLTKKRSASSIAKDHNVSPSVVQRKLESFDVDTFYKQSHLPTVLSFDEFHGVNGMNFIVQNAETGEIFNVLENRHFDHLLAYFKTFPLIEREKVDVVTTDLYQPYFRLIRDAFPHARIVVDRFHITQLIGRAFMQLRTQIMKDFPKGSKEYRHLKRFWKLLQKDEQELKFGERTYNSSFRQLINEREIIDRIMTYHPQLAEHYDFYQDILWSVKHHHFDSFETALDRLMTTPLDERFKTIIRTFKNCLKEIKNSLELPYSNGPLECTNNHIKVIKRIGYGYTNFENFRRRIFLVTNFAHQINV